MRYWARGRWRIFIPSHILICTVLAMAASDGSLGGDAPVAEVAPAAETSPVASRRTHPRTHGTPAPGAAEMGPAPPRGTPPPRAAPIEVPIDRQDGLGATVTGTLTARPG